MPGPRRPALHRRRTTLADALAPGARHQLLVAGKCADSNAYRYDKALAPKVQAALAAVPGVRRGSVWVVIQRRWVYLQGCVPSRELSHRLELAARAVPDVELVLPQLMIGTRSKPPYPVATP